MAPGAVVFLSVSPRVTRMADYQRIFADCLHILVYDLEYKKNPYLAVGWLWYMGTLVPVIGLVQVGLQAMADRYTYVPLVGLFVIIAWGSSDILARYRHGRTGLAIISAVIFALLITTTDLQIRYWKNSIMLNKHAFDVTEDNYVAYNHMGVAMFQKGNIDEAIRYYVKSVQIYPYFTSAYHNMGNALAADGRLDEAVRQYSHALRISPDNAGTHAALGLALIRKGNIEEAVAHFRDASKADPQYDKNLKRALSIRDRIDKAVSRMEDALKISPEDPMLADKLHKSKTELEEAINYYETALSPQQGYRKEALDIRNYGKVRAVMEEYDRAAHLKRDNFISQ